MQRVEIDGTTIDGEGSYESLRSYPRVTVPGSDAQKLKFKRGINQSPYKEVIEMAKDGTARGGARVGAGRKAKALTDKINDGMSATVIELPDPPSFQG